MHAAVELVAERGVDATSMDAIADSSGVGKATIYKRWPDKEALMLEIMAEMNGIHTRPKFDSGDTRADMTAVLAYRSRENAEARERIMPHFMAYSARHPEFGRAWRKYGHGPAAQGVAAFAAAGDCERRSRAGNRF